MFLCSITLTNYEKWCAYSGPRGVTSQGKGFRVKSFRIRVRGSVQGFWLQGLSLEGLGCRVNGLGFRV